MAEPYRERGLVSLQLEYSVRESRRAKYPGLRITAHEGLQVIVPRGFDRSLIPEILHLKRSWIERTRERVEEQKLLCEPEPPDGLPKGIALRAVGEEWAIEYCTAAGAGVTVVEGADQWLQLQGNIADIGLCKAALRRWLSHKARAHLVPLLEQVSQELKLPFGKALVKSQKTRWASCSSLLNITINNKLLFVPQHLVRYVFIHELCHTVKLNHSKGFWSVLGKKEPAYRALREELQRANGYVPLWLDGAGG